ncbi:hypothetical protein [Phenylobacterium sp.]|uniref:hypothetical protein n=1 Tax=Phenylobacterium sp. TaxID=1871053 RepID=UPI0025ED45D5|nr:hypothetical protein [Phenylobacterium sp.]
MSSKDLNEAEATVEATFGARRASPLIVLLLAAAAALCALVSLLPHNAYVRFQQLRDTIQFHAQWVYERIELDPTPIDMAVVGNSRLEAGVSAPELQALLRAQGQGGLHVANLSMPQEGRNIHYVIVKRLLEKHPEVKTLIVSVVEQQPRTGHPAFRYLADADDVALAPMFVNMDYAGDLATLPYRQMSLWAQSRAPEAFGDTATLSKAYEGTDRDTTLTFTLPDGRVVDRDRIVPLPKIAADAEAVINSGHGQLLPASMIDTEYAIERTYTRRIAALAKAHGVRLIFLRLPVYSDTRPVADEPFYRQFGQVWTADFLSSDYTLYSDYGHLNRRGVKMLTPWLAEQLAKPPEAQP